MTNAIFGQVEKLGPEIQDMTAVGMKIMDWAKRLLRVAVKDYR